MPGYGQSSPAPAPTPSYGQVPPNYGQTPQSAPAYGNVPQAPAMEYGQIPPVAPGYGQVPPMGSFQSPGSYAPAPYAGAPSGQPVLATWSKRAYGALVDWVPIFIVGVIGAFCGIAWLTGVLDVLAVAWAIYNIGYLGGSTGVTFGRKFAGTKLVGESTFQPIGAGMGIVRLLAHVIDCAIVYVGFLFPLWTPKKQTIADMIMKTIVIENEPPTR